MISYRSALQLEWVKSIDEYRDKLLPILKKAVVSLDKTSLPAKRNPAWRTEVTFEI